MIAPAGMRTIVGRTTRPALALALLLAAPLHAHDFERTQVMMTFARDGSFVLQVTNDTAWLQHRLIPFGGNFVDRVVLFVDGHEVRPTLAEIVPGPVVSTYRLRGRMPPDAQTLRWYYGLVIDPYPLTIRRADGRIQVEEIAGDAWSGSIDISGQFDRRRMLDVLTPVAVIGLLLVPIFARFARTKVHRSP
jgi:hypothetical protein